MINKEKGKEKRDNIVSNKVGHVIMSTGVALINLRLCWFMKV